MPATMPAMREPGNLNVTAIAGWDAGLEALAEEPAEGRERRGSELAAELHRALSALPGTRAIIGARLPIASLTFEQLEVGLTATLLDIAFGIEARSGLHCAALIHDALGTASLGTLRLSAGHTTTPHEIHLATTALAEFLQELT